MFGLSTTEEGFLQSMKRRNLSLVIVLFLFLNELNGLKNCSRRKQCDNSDKMSVEKESEYRTRVTGQDHLGQTDQNSPEILIRRN